MSNYNPSDCYANVCQQKKSLDESSLYNDININVEEADDYMVGTNPADASVYNNINVEEVESSDICPEFNWVKTRGNEEENA